MRPLTETERDFAEKHHYLVESYLRYRRLDESEYYDVVIDTLDVTTKHPPAIVIVAMICSS